MKAENLLLTHFSQRYPKIPKLRSTTALAPEPVVVPSMTSTEPLNLPSSSAAPEHEPIVAVAFDCASIPIGSMWKMNRYTPILEKVFAELAAEAGEGEGEGEEEKLLREAAIGHGHGHVHDESVQPPVAAASEGDVLLTAGALKAKGKGKGKRPQNQTPDDVGDGEAQALSKTPKKKRKVNGDMSKANV